MKPGQNIALFKDFAQQPADFGARLFIASSDSSSSVARSALEFDVLDGTREGFHLIHPWNGQAARGRI